MKISAKQIAMARILLDLSQKELADSLNIARKTIMRIENEQSPGSSTTLEKIKNFFENNEIEFQEGDGVKRQTKEIRTLKGTDGLKIFLDETYTYLKEHGGIVCLHNAKPNYWYQWLGQEWYATHVERMANIKEKIEFRITSEENNSLFISEGFAEYRWFPEEFFSDQPIYSYADIIAFVNFEEELTINILKNEKFAKGFQGLFNIAWDRVAIKPPPTK
ncbi:MAG: helix-turn-helix transcriptional regulator [Bdellovibrionales bacterium]